jgi:hypothetical protein
MVKYPSRKTNIITLLLSDKTGCGKNLYTDFLCQYVFGEYNTISNLPGIDVACEDKNAEQIGKKIIVIGEMANEHGKFLANFAKMKGKITEKRQRFRPLYSNGFMVDTATEWYALSNHKSSYHIGSMDSRREFCPDVNEKYANNKKFFGPLKRIVENQECGDAFYSYLLDRPISYDEFMEMNMPQTKTKKEVVACSKSIEEEWFDEFLQKLANGDNKQILISISHIRVGWNNILDRINGLA